MRPKLAFPQAAMDGGVMARLAGVELGGTKAVVVLGDGTTIEERVRIDVSDADATLGRISEQLAAWNRETPIEALGIAAFGPIRVDPDAPDYGRVLNTPKPGWEGADVAGTLGAAVEGPASLHTDVTAAALAEGRWGAAQGCTDYAYMTVGTGIGVGVIANERPIVGQLHPEGGHMRVPRVAGDGFEGSCRFHGDCLEGLASGSAIAARIGASGADIADDDPAWPFVIDAIASGCANLLLVLACERIVLGGGVINARPWLGEAIAVRCAEKLGGYLPFVTDRAPLFVAELGQDAGPRGSLLLAEQALESER
jgi:fructokinase